MKKILYTLALALCATGIVQGQMTAMDFNRTDCNGNPHHLFADLDAGKVVILEYIMLNCSPCVNAASKLEAMKADIEASYPGSVKGYSIGFTNSYACADMASWVSTNGFSSYPMDSGSASVAYYGGFGMPTVVILGGGTSHTVLGSPYIGFSTSDTTTMGADIRNFLSTATARPEPAMLAGLEVSPQPANGALNLRWENTSGTHVEVALLDLQGRSLWSESTRDGLDAHINTLDMAAGMYLLRVQADGKVYQRRVVVAH